MSGQAPHSDIKASLRAAEQQAQEVREARELDLPRGCRFGAAVLACLLLGVLAALAVGVLAVAFLGWRLIFGGPL